MELQNWAGNQTFRPERFFAPTSVEEVQQIVRSSSAVRVLGSRHSFNNIADSRDVMISMADIPGQFQLDPVGLTVTVPAGATYGEVGKYLQTQQYALHNTASLPHISVAGAIATATHGSGSPNGNLASAVVGLEFVTADGALLSLQPDDPRFAGVVVGLGAFGAVTKVTLQIQPTYDIRQTVYEHLPFATLAAEFDQIMDAAYSVSLFTKWRGDNVDQAWVKCRDGSVADHFFGAAPASVGRHPLAGVSGDTCTEQHGVSGPWIDRLPHFRMEFQPSSGEEIQSEYLMPRHHAVAAIEAMRSVGERIAPLLMASEIRTVAADDLWLSSSYQQETVAFHFTWKRDWAGLVHILPVVEAVLDPFDPRPHWGKTFTTSPARLATMYPRLDDFRVLVREFDPGGKFRNDFIDTNLFSA